MENAALRRAIPRPVLARALPFGLFLALIALGDAARGLGLDERWVAAMRGPIVAAALLYFWREYSELVRPAQAPAKDWLLAVAAGVAVFVLWINLDAPWMRLGSGPGFDAREADGNYAPALVALRLFGLALVVPVIEELFWRSFLLRWLRAADFLAVDPRAAGWRACAITAVLFALEHSLWLAGLLAGLVYNGLYMRTRNLWMPTIAHAVTNALLGAYILAAARWDLW